MAKAWYERMTPWNATTVWRQATYHRLIWVGDKSPAHNDKAVRPYFKLVMSSNTAYRRSSKGNIEPQVDNQSLTRDAERHGTTHSFKSAQSVDTNDNPATETAVLQPTGIHGAWTYYKKSTVLQAMTGVLLAFIIGITVYETTTKYDMNAIPPEVYRLLALPGNLWLSALRCLVLPLIIANMLISANNLKKMSKSSGEITAFTIGYYLTTTVFAAMIAVMWVYIIMIPFMKPIDPSTIPPGLATEIPDTSSDPNLKPVTIVDQIIGIFTMLVPTNPVKAMATGDLLGVVVVFMVLGFLLDDSETESVILRFAHELNGVVNIVMKFLIMLMPFGVFFLILPSVMGLNVGTIFSYVGFYLATLSLGVLTMWLVVYPLLYLALTRKNPYKIIPAAFPAMATAFGTSSSAATLPVTMDCLVTGLGVRKTIAGFVAPLGCVINMDGASIYICAATVWMALAQGITLSFGNVVVIVLVSTLTSIGASPIPSAGLVFILTTMASVGIPNSPLFGLLVMVDWLADRIAAASNASGDIYAGAVVDARYGPGLDGKGLNELADGVETDGTLERV
jgi:Na+/H+-dicarboxylate symporter